MFISEAVEYFKGALSWYVALEPSDEFMEVFLYENKDLLEDFEEWGMDTVVRETTINRFVQYLIPGSKGWPTYGESDWTDEKLEDLKSQLNAKYDAWVAKFNEKEEK